MAILGNIRKRTGLTIVVIGFAMVAFLLVDAFSGNSTLFGGLNPNDMAEVNGENVSSTEYDRMRNLYNAQSQSGNQSHNLAWNQLLKNQIVKSQSQEIGLIFPPNQAEAFIFNQETPEAAEAYIAELRASAQAGNQQAINQYEFYLANRDILPITYLEQEFVGMVSAGSLATSKEVEWQGQNNKTANIEYAFASYSDLQKNETIEVSDQEIKDYIKKYPTKYKQEPKVNLHFVFFPAEASKEDEETALNHVSQFKSTRITENNDTIPAFANIKDNQTFVNTNSDLKFNPTFQSYAVIKSNPTLKDFVITASVNSVTEPYKYNKAYYVSKFLGKETIDSVNTSHILIPFVADSLVASVPDSYTKEQAKELADSLNNVLQSEPEKFVVLAQQYSKDGSAQQGGKIGWMTKESNLVQPYKDFGFANAKDAIGITETQYGYHIIKIDDKKSGIGYKVANLVKNIEISDDTDKNLYDKVNEFFGKVNGKSLNDFANMARDKDYAYNNVDGLERFESQIGYLNTDQDANILDWAFDEDTKIGSYKKFETGRNGHVIAYVQNKFEKGLNVESVKKQVEPIIKGEKTLALLNEKSKDISIDQFVSNYGARKQNATVSFVNPSIPSIGMEPAVVGAVFGLKDGSTSKLIKGNAGVYIVKTLSKTESTTPASLQQINDLNQRNVQNQLLNSFIKIADVEDNRSKFYKSQN